jgi:hypothetical protein
MRSLLQKEYSDPSLLLREARAAEKLRATELSSHIAQTRSKNVAEPVGGKDGNIKRR